MPEYWDADKERAKSNYSKGNVTSVMINRSITAHTNSVDEYFARAELERYEVDMDELKNILNNKKDKVVKQNATRFEAVMTEFCRVNGEANSWTKETYGKFNNLKNHLLQYKPSIAMSDFDENGLAGYINYLHSIGLRNTTIAKQYSFLKWFLRWCVKKRYLTCLDFETFAPRLKGVSATPRAQLYLEWNEVMNLWHHDYGARHRGLAAVRDVFLFQCFTGLRYSDVCNLKRENITDDCIKIVTKKTSEPLIVELNKYSREILHRYKDCTFPQSRALPVISNAKMNEEIKEACRLACIDTMTQIVYYRGSERYEYSCQKWELVSTHCGRHTFIVHALNLGIPVEVVTQMTGHSSYSAMKPYISITSKAKKNAMQLFDMKDEDEQ